MNYQLPKDRKPTHQFIGGIDPDLDKSGLVIYDRTEKAWFCKTLSQYQLQETIRSNYDPSQLELIVEAGWLNDGFHHYSGFPKGFEQWSRKSQLAYVAKSAVHVGENFGVGKSIVHFFTTCGYVVQEIAPESAKWDAPLFRRNTGLTKGYNEEIRDACRTMYSFI